METLNICLNKFVCLEVVNANTFFYNHKNICLPELRKRSRCSASHNDHVESKIIVFGWNEVPTVVDDTPPSETKCQNCGIFFDLRFPNYVEDRRVLFSEEVVHAETLTIEDYIKKIELHLGYELINRLNMWRYANTNSKAIITEQYRENCKRLIEMLEHTKIDREKLILAELYRNTG